MENLPIPDPTVLTTEALQREVEAIRREFVQTIDLFDAKLIALGELTTERFRALEAVLQMVENRRIEQKADTSETTKNALNAAKEAVAKSEASVGDQLTNLRREIEDVKERVTRGESQKAGAREGLNGLFAIAAFILVLLTIGAIVFGVTAGG